MLLGLFRLLFLQGRLFLHKKNKLTFWSRFRKPVMMWLIHTHKHGTSLKKRHIQSIVSYWRTLWFCDCRLTSTRRKAIVSSKSVMRFGNWERTLWTASLWPEKRPIWIIQVFSRMKGGRNVTEMDRCRVILRTSLPYVRPSLIRYSDEIVASNQVQHE